LHARQEIEYEAYVYKIQIEARLMGDLALNHILPAVVEYQNKLLTNVQGMFDVLGEKQAKVACDAQLDLIMRTSLHMNKMKNACDKMLVDRKDANKITDMEKKARVYCDKVKVHFDEIRYHADKLEILVDDELWPLPKFREMLWTR
jgi:glutamine synthetase